MLSVENIFFELQNKKLLVIFPHPDDETMAAGGLILTAKKLRFKVTVLILTKGGAGQLHIHPKGKTTKQVRTLELEKAVKILGVDKLLLEDFDDGKLREQKEDWSKKVIEVIKNENPGIVVTFDHSGWTGHPDHIVSSMEVKKLLSTKFSKLILLWPVIDPDGKKWMNGEVREIMPKANLKLNLTNPTRLKLYLAACSYKSQRFSDKKLMPILRIILGWREEWYHRVDFSKIYKHKFVKFDI